MALIDQYILGGTDKTMILPNPTRAKLSLVDDHGHPMYHIVLSNDAGEEQAPLTSFTRDGAELQMAEVRELYPSILVEGMDTE